MPRTEHLAADTLIPAAWQAALPVHTCHEWNATKLYLRSPPAWFETTTHPSLKRASRMSMHAAASFFPCTVILTISAPASTHLLTCSTVPATSLVSAQHTQTNFNLTPNPACKPTVVPCITVATHTLRKSSRIGLGACMQRQYTTQDVWPAWSNKEHTTVASKYVAQLQC